MVGEFGQPTGAETRATRTSFSVEDMTIHWTVEQESGFTPMLDFLDLRRAERGAPLGAGGEDRGREDATAALLHPVLPSRGALVR
jgi:hypothetical protein